jgi:hypothetical protein
VRSPTACPLWCRPLGPERPRWLAFARAGLLSAQAEGCSGRRTPSHASAGVAANQSRAPG